MKQPVYLNYHDFDDLPGAAKVIKNILVTGSGACIVTNFPVSENNAPLVSFSEMLGELVHEVRNLEGKSVYKVEVNEKLETPTYANTPLEFLCHTDCTEFDNPPDTVLLLCEKQAKSGGESYLVWVEDLVEKLTMEDIMILGSRQFPFGNKLHPILEYAGQKPVIRYNRVPLDSIIKFYNFSFPEETSNTLDKIDAIMSEIKFSFRLKENECLIINNKTLLHGRGGFGKKSRRLMKRVRLNLT
jgi:hypothetical protein